MFGWFKKKPKADIHPVDRVKVPESVDDWRPAHGDWFSGTFCHCGYQRPEFNSSVSAVELKPTVCPECGHSDKWETYTARREWETSDAIRNAYRYVSAYFCARVETPWERNLKLVRWTEDHCKMD